MFGPPDSWITRGPVEACEYHEEYSASNCEVCWQEAEDYAAERAYEAWKEEMELGI